MPPSRARVRRSPGTGQFRWSRWGLLTALVALLYLLLTLGVVFHSPVLTWDSNVVDLHFRRQHPGWLPFVYYFVMFGQRGPATTAFLPLFFWLAWRDRTSRPLVMLAVSLILLNGSVGIVKLATGRIGPRHSNDVHEIFVGGNIYPSGHVSNAVVLYGLIAILSINHRKLTTALAVFLSVSVAFGTVFLRKHWVSDVIGGWLAGALVLLFLPVVMPFAQRWTDRAVAKVRSWWRRRRSGGGRHAGDGNRVHRPPGPKAVQVLPGPQLIDARRPRAEKVTSIKSDA